MMSNTGATATTRLADAKAALARARAGRDRVTARQHATTEELKRLEARATEVAAAVKATRSTHDSGKVNVAAWDSVLAFAEADADIAEKELAVADAKEALARFRAKYSSGGDTKERTALEEAVTGAEKKLEMAATASRHEERGKIAAEAERHIEASRTADAARNRAAQIDQKLAALKAAAAKKTVERKGWSERGKKVDAELGRLDEERKRLEAERKQLPVRT